MNLIDWAGGQAMAGRDGDDLVEPEIGGGARLEKGRGSEIVLGWVDRDAAVEAFDDGGGTMPHAAIDHVDERSVLGPQSRPNVELKDAVGTLDDPIGTAGKDGSAQPRSVEMPAGDLDDAAVAEGRRAQAQRRVDRDRHREEKFRLDIVHEVAPIFGEGTGRPFAGGCREEGGGHRNDIPDHALFR
jgi:hypothetical protein